VVDLNLTNEIAKIASTDLFDRDGGTGELRAGLFVGRPFYLDYNRAHVLVADSWKLRAKGLPQGSFLLAYYENEPDVSEAVLLRVLRPTKLPTDSDVISSMVEYYKDNLKTCGKESQLDTFTRYEFGFSGLECRVLGTFYNLLGAMYLQLAFLMRNTVGVRYCRAPNCNKILSFDAPQETPEEESERLFTKGKRKPQKPRIDKEFCNKAHYMRWWRRREKLEGA
jgi:hypothetical protein